MLIRFILNGDENKISFVFIFIFVICIINVYYFFNLIILKEGLFLRRKDIIGNSKDWKMYGNIGLMNNKIVN